MPLLTPAERRALRRQCPHIVTGFTTLTPAEEFAAMAAWCEAQQAEHDMYGEGALVEGFEARVAGLLGKPAAVFMPSGVMAQLAAVRIWTEQARLPRFGLHATSHLAQHEEQAFEALLQCHGVVLGHALRPLLAGDLAACRQPLACLLVELPIREAGGQLPSWDELTELSAAARERGIALHMDGARLWESVAFYGRPHAEVAALFDSVYVSVYKGIGGVAGAVLAGSEDFVAQARLWRRRFGGTLHHLSPMVVSAAMRFDERLALMPALYARTVAFAEMLNAVPGLRVNPGLPHTNMFHLYVDAPMDALMAARDALGAETGHWLLDHIRAAEVPGWSLSELYLGDRLLSLDDAVLAPLYARLLSDARQVPR
ncbi:beta-eliminating lyase-related protein [Ideonella azotifigens]|nr:beta-eliminating lyase-related protein [Ideonella azotifigens]MCD2340156.1 beta-eliminating lyase-related protein [Ideonella azotifigens]